jgi:hypothetical protein
MSNGLLDVVKTRRPQLRKALTIVLVAALVAVSILSVFLYVQMKDYHDAKYRSQGVIMGQISTYAAESSSHIIEFTNISRPMNTRAVNAALAFDGLWHLHSMIDAVREMYLDDKVRNSTFTTLNDAIDHVYSYTMVVCEVIVWNSTGGVPMYDFAGILTRLASVAPLMTDLSQTIDSGFLSGVDLEKHPYSVVDHIDLASLREIAASIHSVLVP